MYALTRTYSYTYSLLSEYTMIDRYIDRYTDLDEEIERKIDHYHHYYFVQPDMGFSFYFVGRSLHAGLSSYITSTKGQLNRIVCFFKVMLM